MTVPDPIEWLKTARQGMSTSLLGQLGGEFVSVDEDSLTIRLPISEATRQPFGLVHGGINLYLIETVASSHAAYGLDLNQKVPVGIEVSASHMRSATKGTLVATARQLRRGNTHAVHEVDISLEETGELLSRGRMTNYYKTVSGG